MISQFGVIANIADINAQNAANVMVTATLPPFAKPEQQSMLQFHHLARQIFKRWYIVNDSS